MAINEGERNLFAPDSSQTPTSFQVAVRDAAVSPRLNFYLGESISLDVEKAEVNLPKDRILHSARTES